MFGIWTRGFPKRKGFSRRDGAWCFGIKAETPRDARKDLIRHIGRDGERRLVYQIREIPHTRDSHKWLKIKERRNKRALRNRIKNLLKIRIRILRKGRRANESD